MNFSFINFSHNYKVVLKDACAILITDSYCKKA